MTANAGDYDANKEGTKKIEIAVPLKHHIYHVINCEVTLALS